MEMVQVLSEWNDTTGLILPTCTSVFICTLSKIFAINYSSKDTGFILAQCIMITAVECEVYKIIFKTCASAVNKGGAKIQQKKVKVSMLSLGIEFGPELPVL